MSFELSMIPQLYLPAPPPKPPAPPRKTEKQKGVRNPEPANASKTASGQVIVPSGPDPDDDHDEWNDPSERLQEKASISEVAARLPNATTVATTFWENKRVVGTAVAGAVGCFADPANCAVWVVNAGAGAMSIGNELDKAAVVDKFGNAANDATSAALAATASVGQRSKKAAENALDEASKIPGQIGARINETVGNLLGGGGGGGGVAGGVAQAGGAIGTGFSNIAYAIMFVGGAYFVYKLSSKYSNSLISF